MQMTGTVLQQIHMAEFAVATQKTLCTAVT